MARTTGSNGARTAQAIRRAGLKLIYEHGYEGFGLRQLAGSVGLQPASLYNHFPSKQQLLFGLISDHMDDLIRQTETALHQCQPSPLHRLAAFIANHLAYHIDKRQEVYVANFELRALSPKLHAGIIARRRHYEALLIGILDDGRTAGLIRTADTQVTAYALLAMLTGACTWYKPQGRLARQQMIDLHTRLILDGCSTKRRSRTPAAPTPPQSAKQQAPARKPPAHTTRNAP